MTAPLYDVVATEMAKRLGLPVDHATVVTATLLRLEIDKQAGAQAGGQSLRVGELIAAQRALSELLPPTTVEAEHRWDLTRLSDAELVDFQALMEKVAASEGDPHPDGTFTPPPSPELIAAQRQAETLREQLARTQEANLMVTSEVTRLRDRLELAERKAKALAEAAEETASPEHPVITTDVGNPGPLVENVVPLRPVSIQAPRPPGYEQRSNSDPWYSGSIDPFARW